MWVCAGDGRKHPHNEQYTFRCVADAVQVRRFCIYCFDADVELTSHTSADQYSSPPKNREHKQQKKQFAEENKLLEKKLENCICVYTCGYDVAKRTIIVIVNVVVHRQPDTQHEK